MCKDVYYHICVVTRPRNKGRVHPERRRWTRWGTPILACVQLTGSLCVHAMLTESSGGHGGVHEAVSSMQNKDPSPSPLTDRQVDDR